MSSVTYATTLIKPTKSALRIKDAAMDSDQNVGASAWLRPATEKLWLGYWLCASPVTKEEVNGTPKSSSQKIAKTTKTF